VTSSDLADALVTVAEAFLAGKIAAADNPDVYQVVVHVGAGAGVPAETPEPARPPGHPADPARCHVEDGPAVCVTTADMVACAATLSWMRHGRDGTVLDVGRRRRTPPAALRRAARERDGCRCRFPGCASRRADLHHIRYWSNGGRTSLGNLVSLCRRHHTLCHDADITPGTIVPGWYGERLDLDHALYTCFANAEYQARHRDCADQHDDHPAAPAPRAEPWRPAATEVDAITAIQKLCKAYA
jgi:hypothetical protein